MRSRGRLDDMVFCLAENGWCGIRQRVGSEYASLERTKQVELLDWELTVSLT